MNKSRSRVSRVQAELNRQEDMSSKSSFEQVGATIGSSLHAIGETARVAVQTAEIVNLGLAKLKDEMLEESK